MPSDVIIREFTEQEQETLRREVKSIIETEKLTQTRVAAEMGTGNSTLSAWLSGKYPGDSNKVAEFVRRWVDGREARRDTVGHLPKAPDFIQTAAAATFFATFRQAQFLPSIVSVIGAAGVGKTQAAIAYQTHAPNVFLMTTTNLHDSPRAVLDLIAGELEVETRGISSQALFSRLLRRLKGSGGLLIFDDAQNLSSPAIDLLRAFFDQGIGLALVGNDTVVSRLEGGDRSSHYAPLHSRVGKRTKRYAPTKGDVEPLLDAWGVADPGVRKLLRGLSMEPGALRLMTKALQLGLMMAAGAGEPLGAAHIRLAAADLGVKNELVDAA